MKKFTYSINLDVEAGSEKEAQEILKDILNDKCPDCTDTENWVLRKTSDGGISYDLETGRITDEEMAAAATGKKPITKTIREKAAAMLEEALAKNEKDITGTLLVLEMLEEAFRMDPVSVHTLLCNKVECSQEFAEQHPYIECRPTYIDPERYTVGTLGYINGVLSALNQARVCMVFEDVHEEDDGPRPMSGFDIYEGDKPRDYKSRQWQKYLDDHREALIELHCLEGEGEDEIDEVLNSIVDRDQIIYTLSTYFFDNSGDSNSPSAESKEWVRKKFPDLYKEALEGFFDGNHDT